MKRRAGARLACVACMAWCVIAGPAEATEPKHGAEPTASAQEGLDEICRLDAKHCHGIDMEAYARREVKAEIYAIQNYDNFGCASCSAAGRHRVTPGLAFACLALTLACARRAARRGHGHASTKGRVSS